MITVDYEIEKPLDKIKLILNSRIDLKNMDGE